MRHLQWRPSVLVYAGENYSAAIHERIHVKYLAGYETREHMIGSALAQNFAIV